MCQSLHARIDQLALEPIVIYKILFKIKYIYPTSTTALLLDQRDSKPFSLARTVGAMQVALDFPRGHDRLE